MRKALCVGIDSYENVNDLHGCVNDANSVKAAIERNGDGTLNFDVKLMCATSEASYVTRIKLKDAIADLFSGEPEIALLYYAGHGAYDSLGGYLCTSEISRADEGLSLDDVMGMVAQSKAKNKVVILDSCHSGLASTSKEMPNYSLLKSGTTVLAACDAEQYATEENGHGVFTSLMNEALYGGAMNLLGEVSPGSVYAYIDRSLGSWEQRPLFKANIKSFVSLRKNVPPITITDLRRITEVFTMPYEEIQLDPTYEPDKRDADTDEINKEHEAVFALLQQYVKLGLVVPIGEEHMYFAAVKRKKCKLTAQGQHYWKLVKKNTI